MRAPHTPSFQRTLESSAASLRRSISSFRRRRAFRWLDFVSLASPAYAGMTALLLCVTSPAHAVETVATTITTAQGAVKLQLELANTPETRETGLMNRTSLAPLDGMLFQFPTASDYRFWMKNTKIPLDMLFIAPDQRIAFIAENTTPESLTAIHAGQPIIAVIELAGGRANRAHIAAGDRVDAVIAGTH